MGVGLVRSLQPPNILWIHWRVYNFIANTNKRVLFLPPSDAYVRSFLYLLYTLIKLYYTKALSDQASSLAPDWILLLRGPRIPASWFNNNHSEIQPVHSKGDQPWDFFGRNDAKAETPVVWPPHAKSWLIGKHFDAGRVWGQEEKGTTEDETAGWHASPTRWIWVNSGSWWWTGRPGVLQFMGSQRVVHDWATELNWTEWQKAKIN